MGDSHRNGNLANTLKGLKLGQRTSFTRADVERHSGYLRIFNFPSTTLSAECGGKYCTYTVSDTPRRGHTYQSVPTAVPRISSTSLQVREHLRLGALGAQPHPSAPQWQINHRGMAPACHQARSPTAANASMSRAPVIRNYQK